MGGIRVGVNMTVPSSRAEWVDKCRKAEDLGFDVIGVADHLGMHAPFPAIVLAGEVTERVRLNTFVLNVPFYNAALLARDVATTDQFVDGRLELGLGAGYVKAEFDAAGLPFPSAGERIDHLERTIAELRRLYADPGYKPQPARPGGPPLLVGGWGRRTLGVAAKHADVIAFTGAAPDREGNMAGLAGADEFKNRVEFVRAELGERADDVELNVLVQYVAVTEDRMGVLEQLRQYGPTLTLDQLGELPTLLVGTPEQIAEQLQENKERFGLNYVTVLEPSLDAFAQVIARLR
ncbi:LLM class F420-dependent oxidoreductase [Amycolatopsis taiwanensis]|uniref:LLM class F420-dependent oxidoreductase n=1 Tax=Amycolatopsis taiwanensis TaxID=342230 RepID=A0A9W6R195_9PSEU|nr:LLM class F420-dependent oxidoreductase [Amycolatopsis taiwanensis]GLY67458.1 LLM class F420-dependent oxidoreductase [Amycolatopsis taiwanensis]